VDVTKHAHPHKHYCIIDCLCPGVAPAPTTPHIHRESVSGMFSFTTVPVHPTSCHGCLTPPLQMPCMYHNPYMHGNATKIIEPLLQRQISSFVQLQE